MKQINIIPYVFTYDTSKSYTSEDIEEHIQSSENSISLDSNSGRNIIGKIVSYDVKVDSNDVVERLYLRAGSNFANNRTKAKVKNADMTGNGQLDSDETVLNDLVVVLSFPGASGSVFTTGQGDDMGIIYLIYEGHSTYAVNSLDHILSNTLEQYNIGYSAFSHSDQPLKDVRNLVTDFEMNLVTVKNDKETIVGKTFLKNKGEIAKLTSPIETIKECTESLFEYIEGAGGFDQIKRKFYVNAFGKKIRINDDGAGNFHAKGFPQQINVFDFRSQYVGIKNLFLNIFRPQINDTILKDPNLEISISPFIQEYENSISNK